MKKIKPQILFKIVLVVFLVGALVFSANIIYVNFTRANRINPVYVESYQLHLKTGVIEKAAQAFEEKESRLQTLMEEMQKIKQEEKARKEKEAREKEEQESSVEEMSPPPEPEQAKSKEE